MKEFLSHHKIPFVDRNVVEDPAAMEELVQKIGRRATPVIAAGMQWGIDWEQGSVGAVASLV